LVLDEVQSLRNSLHGMHFSLGLPPDLLTRGKVIGGGLPVGAVGGSASLLELTNVQKGGRISHSGTFNGNVATMAAGAASIRALDEPTISWLNERAESLAPMIEAAAHRQGVPASVTRAGSILHVHLVDHPPTCAEDDRTSPPEWASVLHLALLLEGVYAAPRGMLNLSSALDDRQLARVVVAYEHAFERIKDVVCTGKTYESDREMTP
jgi:glutamate-1-semialdehyde 2,1-aminomutase